MRMFNIVAKPNTDSIVSSLYSYVTVGISPIDGRTGGICRG